MRPGAEAAASATGDDLPGRDPARPRRLFRRRGNRRILVLRCGPLGLVASGLAAGGRALGGLGRAAAALALVALLTGAALGAVAGYAHLLGSPRFAVRAIAVTPTTRLTRAEVLALAGVGEGDPLLALDRRAIVRRLAGHPWIARADVRRRLPGTLVVDLTERVPAALASLAGLYLVDAAGRPFKRATMAEAEGLPVLSGIERQEYVRHRQAVEAAYREALAVLAAYRARPERPAAGEVRLDPAAGVTLFLAEGGGEIRLGHPGQGRLGEKLARLDRILEAVRDQGLGGTGALRVVHLDTPGGRVPVRLRTGGT